MSNVNEKLCREVNLSKFLFRNSPELYFPRRTKDLGDWMNQRLSPTQGNLKFGVQSLIIWTFSCIVTVFACESSALSKGVRQGLVTHTFSPAEREGQRLMGL